MRFVLEIAAESQRRGAAIVEQEGGLLGGELRGGEQRDIARGDGGEIGEGGAGLIAHADHHPRAGREAASAKPRRQRAHVAVERRIAPALLALVADDDDRGLARLGARMIGDAIAREIETRGDGVDHALTQLSRPRPSVEQARHALLARRAGDGLADQRADRDDANVARLLHRGCRRDRVGEHQLFQLEAATRSAAAPDSTPWVI